MKPFCIFAVKYSRNTQNKYNYDKSRIKKRD